MPNRASGVATAAAGAFPRPHDPRRSSLFEVIALAMLAGFGALAMLPSPTEKMAVLVAEERYPEAISLLEDKARRLPLSDYETFSLATLYRRTGETERAAQMLEELALRLPHSRPVLTELADIYHTTARPADELRVLVKSYALAPAPEVGKRLLRLFESGVDDSTAGTWRP